MDPERKLSGTPRKYTVPGRSSPTHLGSLRRPDPLRTEEDRDQKSRSEVDVRPDSSSPSPFLRRPSTRGETTGDDGVRDGPNRPIGTRSEKGRHPEPNRQTYCPLIHQTFPDLNRRKDSGWVVDDGVPLQSGSRLRSSRPLPPSSRTKEGTGHPRPLGTRRVECRESSFLCPIPRTGVNYK